MKLSATLTKNIALCSLIGAFSFSCAVQKNKGGALGIVSPLSDDTVIVEYSGGKITAKDVASDVDAKIKQLNEEAVQAYTQSAQNMALRKIIDAEAKAKGLSTEALISQSAGPVEVTEKEIDDIFKANPQLKKGIPDPQTGKLRKISRDEVKTRLGENARRSKQQQVVESFMAKANVKTILELPRTPISLSDDFPSHGAKNAKVVVHEFSDFQCPFCEKGRTLANQIKQQYGDKVRLVFRQFPLSFHPEARGSALASICANKQSKFWEYHDKLFDNQKTLSESNYPIWAKELGLDIGKFTACYKDAATAKLLENDMKEAETLGVNSTPTFFVNGKKVAGALPFDQFKTMIDAELAKK